MKTHRPETGWKAKLRCGEHLRKARAFSLIEVTFAMGLIGVVLIGMLGGVNWVVSCVQWTRENARATQLMEEKLDTLRLYSWDQINTPGFIKTNFVGTFSSLENGSAAPTNSDGITY